MPPEGYTTITISDSLATSSPESWHGMIAPAMLK